MRACVLAEACDARKTLAPDLRRVGLCRGATAPRFAPVVLHELLAPGPRHQLSSWPGPPVSAPHVRHTCCLKPSLTVLVSSQDIARRQHNNVDSRALEACQHVRAAICAPAHGPGLQGHVHDSYAVRLPDGRQLCQLDANQVAGLSSSGFGEMQKAPDEWKLHGWQS